MTPGQETGQGGWGGEQSTDYGVRQTGQTPTFPFGCGLGLGLSFYTCEMEVIPPTLQDCCKDEE